MEKWLNSKVESYDSIYDTNTLVLNNEINHHFVVSDLVSDDYLIKYACVNKLYEDKLLNNIRQYIYNYADEEHNNLVLIPPSSNRYHCHYLFMKMLETSNSVDFYLDNKKMNLKDNIKNIKNEFYKFCYLNR